MNRDTHMRHTGSVKGGNIIHMSNNSTNWNALKTNGKYTVQSSMVA